MVAAKRAASVVKQGDEDGARGPVRKMPERTSFGKLRLLLGGSLILIVIGTMLNTSSIYAPLSYSVKNSGVSVLPKVPRVSNDEKFRPEPKKVDQGERDDRVFPKPVGVLQTRPNVRPSGKVKRTESPLSNEATPSDLVLLLASHQRLVLYNVNTDKYAIVDEGDGNYYGMMPGPELSTVWISQSTGRGPGPNNATLFDLALGTNQGALRTAQVDTRYMHDMIANPDLSNAFAVDVAGSVISLKYSSMVQFKRYPVFSVKEHINTLAYTKQGTLWVMLHNIGPSKMVQLNLYTGERMCEVTNIGREAHGLVLIEEDTSMLVLSSGSAALVKIKLPPRCFNGMIVKAEKETIWTYEDAGNPTPQRKFLKGLFVANNIAYFGLSDHTKSRIMRQTVTTSLVAVNIATGEQLWIREGPGTGGIINVIGTPHISADSTYREQSLANIAKIDTSYFTALEWTSRGSEPSSASNGAQVEERPVIHKIDESTKIDTTTPQQCSKLYFDKLSKYKSRGWAFGLTEPNHAFYRVPLNFDVAMMHKEMKALQEENGFEYRADVNNYFLLLVTKNGELEEGRVGPFAPVPERLSKSPYLRRVMDELGIVCSRSRFMMLKSGEKVKRHRDQVNFIASGSRGHPSKEVEAKYSHGFWGRRFRVHIPIVSHPEVTFTSGGSKIFMEPGYAYLFDNGNPHEVENGSPIDRVHFIIDTIGTPRLFNLMEKATVFMNDDIIKEGEAPTRVSPDTDRDALVAPLYEDWRDANAFEFMTSSSLGNYLHNDVLLRTPESSAREDFSKMLVEFLSDYNTSCETKKDLEACNLLLETFLQHTVELFQCSNPEPVTLLNSKHTVADAVEAVLRMSYFACEKTDERNTPQDSRQNTILPLPGHPFSLPGCDRGYSYFSKKMKKT